MAGEISKYHLKTSRSIKGLRLDLAAARRGDTWLLLPEGYRDQDSGDTYPLPTQFRDIDRLAKILIPRNKQDSGCRYLRRAGKRYKEKWTVRQANASTIDRVNHELTDTQSRYNRKLRNLAAEARASTDAVKEVASECIASLDDLFSLGRKGIAGMMKAHLTGEKWQGEEIKSAAFRNCYRMVAQTVKALGLPTGERGKARGAVLEQVAASIKATKEAVAMAPAEPDEPPTEH